MSSSSIIPRDILKLIYDYVPKTRFVIKVHKYQYYVLKLKDITKIEGPYDSNDISFFKVLTKNNKNILYVYYPEHKDAYNAIADMIK